MMEQVIAELEQRIAAFTDLGDSAPILDDEIDGLTRRLAPDGHLPDDAEAGGVLALLRYYRFLASPGADSSEDVAAALAYLRTWGGSDPDALLARLPPLHADGGVGSAGEPVGPCGPWQSHLRGQILAQNAAVTGDLQRLDRGIQELRAARAGTAPDHPNLSSILSDLAGALRLRYELAGEADLDEAVTLAEEALVIASADSPERARQQVNLSSALIRRFEHSTDQHDLEAAVRHGREAVAGITDARYRAMALANLGATLRISFDYTGRESDGREAIRVGEQAVSDTPSDDPQYAIRLSNLSGSWQSWGAATGDPADLDTAVRFGRQAVEAAPDSNPILALCWSNLGYTLHTRYERLAVPEDLTEAVHMCRIAVDAAAPGDPQLPLFLVNLGIALETVADTGRDVELTNTALSSYRDAVHRLPPHHAAVAGSLSNVGQTLRARFVRHGDPEDLRQAIEACAEAVRVAAPDHPRRPLFLSNLSLALRERARVCGRFRALFDLITASRLAVEAITATPAPAPESAQLRINYAGVMAARYELTHRRRHGIAATDEMRAAAAVSTAPASVRLRAARAAAALAANVFSPDAALDDAAHAVELLPLVAWHGIGRTGQERQLIEAKGVGAEAAALALAAGRPSEAVVLVEQARAVLWTQLLDMRTELSDLQRTAPQVAARLSELRILLDTEPKGSAL